MQLFTKISIMFSGRPIKKYSKMSNEKYLARTRIIIDYFPTATWVRYVYGFH